MKLTRFERQAALWLALIAVIAGAAAGVTGVALWLWTRLDWTAADAQGLAGVALLLVWIGGTMVPPMLRKVGH